MNQLTEYFYQSDQINLLFGFDGSEDKKILSWFKNYSRDFPKRIVIGLNQFYPEFKSSCYFNKSLVGLLQESLAEINHSISIEDYFCMEGIIPIEPYSSLEFSDDYILLSNNRVISGRLRLWPALGGKSAFYHDKIIIEMAVLDDFSEIAFSQIYKSFVDKEIKTIIEKNSTGRGSAHTF